MPILGQKNILITGGSAGIGKAIAIATAGETSGTIFVCGRDEKRLQEVISSCRDLSSGASLVQVTADLLEPGSLDRICAQVKGNSSPLDCLVFSAGVDKAIPFKMANQKFIEDLLRINTAIPLELCRLLLKGGLINPGASIVFISSVMGILGQPGQVAYCATKGALISAAKALALELSGSRVRVNVLAPGIVKTDLTDKLFSSMSPEAVEKITQMHPLGLGEPGDIAELTLFLFSEKSKWITGSTITIDGGYSAQ